MKKVNRRQVLQGIGFVSGIALAKGCGNRNLGTNEASAQGISAINEAGDASTVANVGTDSNACVLFPEQTEGPYYLDLNLLRKDITEGKPGVPLRLSLRVVDVPGCTPISDAAVDIWHCDAGGIYAGYGATATNPERFRERNDRNSANQAGAREPRARGGPHQEPINNQTFLRGTQVTDADGRVEFLTIYPGWYAGRTTHIHLKVHLDSITVLTSQMYFPDEITNAVYTRAPYDRRPNRDTTNDSDRVISMSGDVNAAWLNVSEDGDDYVGSLTIGVQRA